MGVDGGLRPGSGGIRSLADFICSGEEASSD